MIVACGLMLRWYSIAGLEATLGRNGVTSNYRYELSRYIQELVKDLRQGKAIFCQPPPPIKCAGAPQKALYLSCDRWRRERSVKNIQVSFCLARRAVFGVAAFVPTLHSWLAKYGAHIHYGHNLIAVDGERKLAMFAVAKEGKKPEEATMPFDMLHVVPPQSPRDFIAESSLGDKDGWCLVDKFTLQHPRWPTIFSLGDCCSSPNAKTAAAARKQMTIVAENLRCVIRGDVPVFLYDGYGSCPLTVQKGKVVLAEFAMTIGYYRPFPSI